MDIKYSCLNDNSIINDNRYCDSIINYCHCINDNIYKLKCHKSESMISPTIISSAPPNSLTYQLSSKKVFSPIMSSLYKVPPDKYSRNNNNNLNKLTPQTEFETARDKRPYLLKHVREMTKKIDNAIDTYSNNHTGDNQSLTKRTVNSKYLDHKNKIRNLKGNMSEIYNNDYDSKNNSNKKKINSSYTKNSVPKKIVSISSREEENKESDNEENNPINEIKKQNQN